ncbi:protein takeout-like [Anoplophora glabripennis]|uniref:protein takeout-like n=1 Tax=Anoplophora glabripennis TaxID=217634 RepID=UPI0008744850|nr:protein takeout-like [Anoplophora glabripennis]
MKSFFIVVILVPLVLSYTFPENFKRCHRNEIDLDNCLKTTIQNALQLIGMTGIPSLNLPPIDPLKAAKLEVKADTSTLHVVQKYFDMNIFGFSNSTVENAHFDTDKNILTFTIYVPKIYQKAKYDINGKIMDFSIFGNGDSILTLFNSTLTHTIKFQEDTKDNKSYFIITSYNLSVITSKIHFYYDNLFNSDKQLSEKIHKILNENWKGAFGDVKEGVQTAYAHIFKNVAIGLFNRVPVEEIFLN